MKLSFIKLDIDIMNDSKIKIIRKLPAGNDILVVWIGILCLAMKSGRLGHLEVGDGIPFNDELLSAELDVELNTIRLALKTFEKLRMIEVFENGNIYVTNFEKHQELDKIEMAKEKARIRVQNHRQKAKQLCNGYETVTVTESNATDIDQDIDQDKELDKDKDKDHAFEQFWETYDKKQDKPKVIKIWHKLKQQEKDDILDHVGKYVQSTPDKQYRKNPMTYLNSRSWENEIIEKVNKSKESEFLDEAQVLYNKYGVKQ